MTVKRAPLLCVIKADLRHAAAELVPNKSHPQLNLDTAYIYYKWTPAPATPRLSRSDGYPGTLGDPHPGSRCRGKLLRP